MFTLLSIKLCTLLFTSKLSVCKLWCDIMWELLCDLLCELFWMFCNLCPLLWSGLLWICSWCDYCVSDVSVCVYCFEIEKSYVIFVCTPSAKEIHHLHPWPKWPVCFHYLVHLCWEGSNLLCDNFDCDGIVNFDPDLKDNLLWNDHPCHTCNIYYL